MDNHKAKRRRHQGGQYHQLHDDTDSIRSSIIRRRQNENRSVLCDKCWVSHTRRRATRRCLNCKQNLCSYCAKIDETRRRTWWPSLLISCWRFLFLKAFKRHTIVDLEPATTSSDQSSHEKQSSHSLPRTDTPRSSYSGKDETYERNREQNAVKPGNNDSGHIPDLRRPNNAMNGQHRYYCPNAQAIYRAYSFDKHLNKKRSSGHKESHLRRTRSAERLPNKEFIDRESEFRNLYHQNWEREPFDFHRAHVVNNPDHKQNPVTNHSNAAADKENVKPKAESKGGGENNERRFKRGKTSRRGIKHVADIFPENSKTNDSEKYSQPPSINDAFQEDRHTFQQNTQYKQNYDSVPPEHVQKESYNAYPSEELFPESERATPYIVEEPPDACPVCLETIPGRQARRLACSHTIHTRCLIDFLNKVEFDFGVKCPICNQITRIRNYYKARHLWYKELPVVIDC